MQNNRALAVSPSTITFIVDENKNTIAKEEKEKVETAKNSTQLIKCSLNGTAKKPGGMKYGQKGGLNAGKRSEASIRERRQSGPNREMETIGKRWGRTDIAERERRRAPANASRTSNTCSSKGKSNGERVRCSPNRIICLNKGMRRGDAISIAIHLSRDRTTVFGKKSMSPSPKKAATSEVTPPVKTAIPKEILETASSFKLSKPHPTNWEVNSDVSSSTFVVEPAKPNEVNQRKRGKSNCVADTLDREEKKEKSDWIIRKWNNRRGGKMMKCDKGMTKKKLRKTQACFKIYKRCIPKSLCRRWRSQNSSGESTEGETAVFPPARRRMRLLMDRTSEPWMRKEFVWRNRKEGGRSALSVNSSLGHINCDDSEEFSCWERVPTGAITCTWEAFLYKWKKSWSVLSVAAFRKNRLSDTPGEILQILKHGNGFTERRSPQDRGVPESPREDLAPSSPFDVEPSIYQKNIDVRNWVDALRFHSVRPEEERAAVHTTEEMVDIFREGNAFSTLLALLLGLLAVGYLIAPNLSDS